MTSSAFDGLDLVNDGKVSCVESNVVMRSSVIGDSDDEVMDEIVETGDENVFVDFVTGGGAFDDVSLIDNGKVACASENDFVDGVTGRNVFDGLTLIGDNGVACV